MDAKSCYKPDIQPWTVLKGIRYCVNTSQLLHLNLLCPKSASDGNYTEKLFCLTIHESRGMCAPFRQAGQYGETYAWVALSDRLFFPVAMDCGCSGPSICVFSLPFLVALLV